ncbi:MAG: histidinol dehydrogenase [Candidatus Hodarchaeaceae archaeon]|nr:histidinol dehydrogenase [Candidatus Hodarchaeaceae archaeon]
MKTPLKVVRLWECSSDERKQLLKRSELDVASVVPRVREIVEDVRRWGDDALIKYTERFDGIKLRCEQLRIASEEVSAAYEQTDAKFVGAIKSAARAIRKFHLKQVPRGWIDELQPGVKAGQLVRPLERVGVYSPGGLARYPSSVLMAVVPARVAGVERVIVCTPPLRDGKVDPATLVAADVAGADEVFRVGGAQAVAAMAYGTRTVPRVDKIVGPGNVYVVAAKQVVAADVDIDFAAGPSEILILADSSADPSYVAADLIAQAEHDPAAAAVLVTTSEELASRVCELVRGMAEEAPRKDIVLKSLGRYGRVLVARDLADAVEFVNDYAPEHLQLMVGRPKQALKKIRNAGAVFIGPYAPATAGDLAVGPSHILPTGGSARRCSGLSVLDFVRLPSVQMLTKRGLERLADIVEKLAEVEGLPGHAQSIRTRLKK